MTYKALDLDCRGHLNINDFYNFYDVVHLRWKVTIHPAPAHPPPPPQPSPTPTTLPRPPQPSPAPRPPPLGLMLASLLLSSVNDRYHTTTAQGRIQRVVPRS